MKGGKVRNMVFSFTMMAVLLCASNVFAYKDTKTYGEGALIDSDVKYLKQNVEQQKEIISLLKEIKKNSQQKELMNLLRDIRRILSKK